MGIGPMTGLMNEGLMWGMGVWGFVVLALIIFGLAALVNYVFFR